MNSIGELTTILFARSGVSSNIFSSGPIQVSNDITDFSLRESIGICYLGNSLLQLS